jgi:hypothetical protein
MRRPIASPLLALMTLLLFGCGQTSNPPVNPGPAARDPATKGVDDAVEILKAINEANKAAGPLASGVSQGVTQVGSHRIKTIVDVSTSTVLQDERAVVSLGERKLAVEFDTGQVFLDDNEKAKLPAGTKEVEIHFMGGKLTVKADGTALSIPGAPQ